MLATFFAEFDLPREYTWQRWDSSLRPLRFARDNYSNMDGFQETQVDVGHFFGAPGWRRNIWANELADAPYSARARRDLLRWRAHHGPISEAESRTYKHYLETVCGYDPAVTRMVEPIIGLLSGLVAIGHSELNGAQHWGSALEYGKRAGEKAAGML